MKVVVHDKAPGGWTPRRGELCWYNGDLCLRTDIPFGTQGALVTLGSGFAYRGKDRSGLKPFYGTITADNEEEE